MGRSGCACFALGVLSLAQASVSTDLHPSPAPAVDYTPWDVSVLGKADVPDVTCLKEKEPFRLEPWGELLITVFAVALGKGRAEVGWMAAKCPSTSAEDLTSNT